MSVHYKNYPWQFCPFEQLWRLPGLLTLFDNTYVLNNSVAFLRFNAIITSFINFRLNDWLKFFPKKFFFVPLKVEATLICIHRVKHTCRSLAQIIPSSNYKYIVKWYPAHLDRAWQKKKPVHFSGTSKSSSWASNFLYSLAPWARIQASHRLTKYLDDDFETNIKFQVHG